jgi:Ion channel
MSAAGPERERLAGPPARPRRPLGERIRDEDSYGLLLLLILLSLLLTGLVGDGRLGRLVLTVTSGSMTLFAFWTSRPEPRVLRWAVVLVSLSVVAASLAVLIGSGTALDGAGRTLIALLTAASPVAVARRLLHHSRVRGSTVLGALCIYLLLGLFYAYLFWAVGVLSSPFFAQIQQATMVDYMYFSYVTLATVGYGDLTAATDVGRMLAISEALIGQLYLVTVVALLVANLGRDRTRGSGT